jgi:hypothetical protein
MPATSPGRRGHVCRPLATCMGLGSFGCSQRTFWRIFSACSLDRPLIDTSPGPSLLLLEGMLGPAVMARGSMAVVWKDELASMDCTLLSGNSSTSARVLLFACLGMLSASSSGTWGTFALI